MRNPKIFISYSHDSIAHSKRVRLLADRLRGSSLDCMIDQYEQAPAAGWPRWMDAQVEEADFVLVVCTPAYYRKAMGQDPPGTGHGVIFESLLIVQDLYDAAMRNEKFIPVLFEDLDLKQILRPLRGYTRYRVDTQDGYESLLRHLTGQPRIVMPELGALPVLPPEASPFPFTGSVEPAGEDDEQPRKAGHLRWRWWSAAGLSLACAGVLAAALGAGHFGSGAPGVLPSQPEARQRYQEGLKSLARFDAPQAKRSFERVLKIQDFPPARSLLAEALVRIGQGDAALSEAQKAFDDSSRLPSEERLQIKARLLRINLEWNAAIQAYQQLLDRYPKSSSHLEYGFGLAESQIGARKGKDALLDLAHLEPSAKGDPRFYLWKSWAAVAIPDYALQRDAATLAIQAVEGREGYRQLEAKVRLFRGIALLQSNDLAAAVPDFIKAAQYYGKDDPRGKAQAIDPLAQIWFYQGKFELAKEARQSAINVYEALQDEAGLASQHLRLAQVLSEQGELTAARREGELALQQFFHLRDDVGQAQALSDLGVVSRRQGHLKEARAMIKRSQGFQIEDEEETLLSNLAEVQLREMDLKLAEDNFERVRQGAATANDAQGLTEAWRGLGEVAVAQGNLDRAETSYREALKLGDEFKLDQAASQVGLAAVLLEKGQPEKATAPLEQALLLFRGEHLRDQEAQAEALEARALLAQGRKKEARNAIERAHELAGPSEIPEIHIEVALAEARVRNRLGEREPSLKILQDALARAQQAGLLSQALEARLILGGIEAGTGDRSRLENVEREARIRGFLLIAGKARRFLEGHGPVPA